MDFVNLNFIYIIRMNCFKQIPNEILEIIIKKCVGKEILDYNKKYYNKDFSCISEVCKEWNYTIKNNVEKIRFSEKKRISPLILAKTLSVYKNITNLYFDNCKWLSNDHMPYLGIPTKLNLISFDFTRLETLAFMPRNNNVKYLFTRGGCIRAGFNQFQGVEFINAASSSIYDLYVLKECALLKTLILSFTYVTNLNPVFLYCKQIEKIDTSNCIH